MEMELVESMRKSICYYSDKLISIRNQYPGDFASQAGAYEGNLETLLEKVVSWVGELERREGGR